MSRSAIFLPRTKAFPDNSEIEAIVTYTGEPTDPVDALLTVPLGIFAAGLDAVQPTGELDLAQVIGHTNVSIAVTPPITCGGSETVTGVIGNPLLSFYTSVIRVGID